MKFEDAGQQSAYDWGFAHGKQNQENKMQTDTEQLMKKLHASLCPDKLEAEIRDKFLAMESEIERLIFTLTQESLARENVSQMRQQLSKELTAALKDTELLDFLENEHFDNVFPLGKTWYSRLAYGQPYKKHSTLRSAIITAINNKEQTCDQNRSLR